MALYYHVEDFASSETTWNADKMCLNHVGGGPRLHLSSIPRTGYFEYSYIQGKRIPCPAGTYLRDIFVDDKVTIPEWSTETFKNCTGVKKIHYNRTIEVEETVGEGKVKKIVYDSDDFDCETKYDYHGETLWKD